MTTMDGHIDVKGARVRYSEAGAGETVVILDAGMWAISPLQEALAGSYRVVRLELTGFSEMSEETSPKSVEETAGLVVLAMSKLNTEKYSLIAGSSAARIALWQALLAPGQVEALVLISPIALLPTGDPSSVPPDRLVARSENVGRLGRSESVRSGRMSALTGSGAHDSELESRLGEVSCATLAVFGQSDQMVAPEAPRIYREKMPNCNISFVYDAGHAILADRPEALIGAVADFIERRETFIVGRESGLINP